jgi:pyrimidine operon attenuation protein/uracil phosphoribosyltransferase
MSADDVRRAITRIGHEIVERNHGLDGVVLVGLQRGGVWIAEVLAEGLRRIDGTGQVQVGTLDVSFYRDDVGLRPIVPAQVTDLPPLDALNDHGRPRAVQLAVIVDRGHRELPIRPDYVGKNLPTSRAENVTVSEEGVVIE